MASPKGTGNMANIVSQRASQTAGTSKYPGIRAQEAISNPFHPKDNPQGIINMGRSLNYLMEEELEKRLQQDDALRYSRQYQHYYELFGTRELRTALADLLQRHLCQGRQLDPENIIVLNGVASCLDALGHAICDPGDVLIAPTPVYARIFNNFKERALVDVQGLDTSHKVDAEGRRFTFTPEDLEQRVKELTTEGKNVKGIILVHPHNPMGDFYSKIFLQEILRMCSRNKLHVIIDEIYALSIFEDRDNFISTLAMQEEADPQRVHFVWGLTKDFGLASFRVGVIHTMNQDVISCLKKISTFQCTPLLIQHAAATIINDKDWCDNFFLPSSRKKLADSCSVARTRLQEMGLEVRGGKAALFLWVNAQAFLKENTKEGELELFEAIFQKGVFINPGSTFHCTNPGWYRIVFSIHPQDLQLGLEKIKSVLDERRKSVPDDRRK